MFGLINFVAFYHKHPIHSSVLLFVALRSKHDTECIIYDLQTFTAILTRMVFGSTVKTNGRSDLFCQISTRQAKNKPNVPPVCARTGGAVFTV